MIEIETLDLLGSPVMSSGANLLGPAPPRINPDGGVTLTLRDPQSHTILDVAAMASVQLGIWRVQYATDPVAPVGEWRGTFIATHAGTVTKKTFVVFILTRSL